MKTKLFVVVVSCVPFLVWLCMGMQPTAVQFLDRKGKEHTLQLSVRERKRLLGLMRCLFAEDSFAYTLLGSKPVSWACYVKPLPFVDFSLFLDSWKRYSRTLRLGWEVWSKHRHVFPFLRFGRKLPRPILGASPFLFSMRSSLTMWSRQIAGIFKWCFIVKSWTDIS